MLEWNDGLSVGIEALDNDHKKLLEIINNLSLHIENGLTEENINDVFDNLTQYGVKHFYREESFMQKCHYDKYDEHILQHQGFVDEIPKLKKRLLNAKDNFVIQQEINTYLVEWLIKHIINEDMVLIPQFEKYGLVTSKKKSASFFLKIIRTITQNITLTKRILLSALLPLIAMIVLGFVIIIDNYTKHQELKKASHLTTILYNINEFVHVMQIERGLSTGYIISKDDKFKVPLLKQHILVEKKLVSFLDALNKIDTKIITTIQSHIKTLQEDVLNIKNIQKSVDAKEISKTNMLLIYTKTIDNILDITLHIAFTNNDIEVSKAISSLSAIAHLKESLGLKRAYGTMILEQGAASTQEYIRFIQLIGAEENHLHMFQQFATPLYSKMITKLLSTTLSQDIRAYEKKISQYNYKSLDSKKWFEVTSQNINKIKIIEDKLLLNINTLIDRNKQKSVQNLISWIFIIILIFAVTLIAATLFDYSSKREIYKFIIALKKLSNGERAIKLNSTSLKDSMSQMYTAYESMRQKLLEGDIYTELFKKRTLLELQNQEKQNSKLEKLASIDSLTGCINRRKFESISNAELHRSLRHKHKLSFLMLDIDYFKSINDTYGHAIGDEVLKHFSSTCLKLSRDMDSVARVGGEEFIIILPETDIQHAYTFAERVRKEIYDSEINIQEHKIRYTVSIGISTLSLTNSTTIDTILHEADSALYTAKESGRNKSVIYNS